MVNGMFAHADETDDTSENARMHPGASIIPAALAVADSRRSDGKALLNAVLTGYQVGIAFPLAIWARASERMHAARTTHNAGQVMGAVAAAGSLLELDIQQMQYALSYAAQLASGINSLYREKQHVEKAYVFGGMPAEQGVRAALFASLGFTGVPDIFDQSVNFFDTFAGHSDPNVLMHELSNQEGGVFQADIKLYSVGLPIQAAAQAMDEILVNNQNLNSSDVLQVTCHLPSQKAYIVDNREMPAICLQFILATMLEDRGLTFENAHDQERLNHSRQHGLMTRVELIHDDSLNPVGETGSRNRAQVHVRLKNGTTLSAQVDELRGTRFALASWSDMRKKAISVMGSEKLNNINELIDMARNFETAYQTP